MLATATSLAESKAVNMCEDILAKENIDKDQKIWLVDCNFKFVNNNKPHTQVFH